MTWTQRAEDALAYLEESESEGASLKAATNAEKERLKTIKAQLMLDSDEKTVAGRETWAEAHERYIEALNGWDELMSEFYLIDARRSRAELLIEFWRSLNSAQKRGEMV